VDHRRLGAAGPAVSLLGLGCNNFGGRIDFAATRAVVHRALDLGVTLFDTADNYGDGGSEEFLGRILGPRRKEIILATKFGIVGGASRRHVLRSAEASLKRLATDYIDLYQLHRPDAATPIAETLGALDELVRAGKVRQIGCSYLTGAAFEESCQAAAKAHVTPFTTCQNEYSLLVRGIERDLVPALARHEAGFLPYLPLAGGLLTGKYRRDLPFPKDARLSGGGWPAGRVLTEANWRIVERLLPFCAARGHTILDLALSWLAQRPFVTSIIAGATKPEQVAANLAALSWSLSPEDRAEIDRLTLTP
jgi:aryl-alcohol dehydrogenase-like predicted oxidoreductase